MKTFERLPNHFFEIEINTGTPNVIDARGQSISRGVHNGVAFANFKAHKFSYLNITALGTDYVINGDECGFACAVIPSCFSFNLAAVYDINGRVLCELLPSDKYNNSDKFISSQLFHHFSPGVSTSLSNSWKCILINDSRLPSSRATETWDQIFSAAMCNFTLDVIKQVNWEGEFSTERVRIRTIKPKKQLTSLPHLCFF